MLNKRQCGGYGGEPSICRYGLRIGRPKGRARVTKLVWRTILSTLEVVSPALMMRGGAMDGGRVIA